MRYRTLRKGGYDNVTEGFDLSGGGLLTGPLLLFRDPLLNLEAVTKRYVDNKLLNLNAANFKTGIVPLARLSAYTGDVSINEGSNVVNLNNVHPQSSIFTKVTVDVKGRVTAGGNLTVDDLPEISWNKINENKPTTLAGYGITDALTPAGGTMQGMLKVNVAPSHKNHVVNKGYVDGANSGSFGTPVGTIIKKITQPTTPTGFLKCNGGRVSKTTYANLYAVIGDSFNRITKHGFGKPWERQYYINEADNDDVGNNWTVDTDITANITEDISDYEIIVTKNKVYIIGGSVWSYPVYYGPSNKIYKADINPQGLIGPFTLYGTLPVSISEACSCVLNNRVYLFGGHTDETRHVLVNGVLTQTSISNKIYYSEIDSNGYLTGFNLYPVTMQIGVIRSNIYVTDTHVFIITGNQMGSDSNTDGTEAYNSMSETSYGIIYQPFEIEIDGGLVRHTGSSYYGFLEDHDSGDIDPVFICYGNSIVITTTKPYPDAGLKYTKISSLSTASRFIVQANSDTDIAPATVSNLHKLSSMGRSISTSKNIFLMNRHDFGFYLKTKITNPALSPFKSSSAWEVMATEASLHGQGGDEKVVITSSRLYVFEALSGTTFLGNTTPAKVYHTSFNGGYNDYSKFYDGTTVSNQDPLRFRLPDYEGKELPFSTTYIKY